MKIRNCLIFAAAAFTALIPAAAQSHISTQAHQAPVTAIAPVRGTPDSKTFFSAGQDGFLVKWTDDDQGDHYQISELTIKFAVCSPDGQDIAVYETDGGLINRVSVWNWATLTRKYARRFSDSVTSLSYSAAGNYLIVGTATVDGAVFLRASTGDVIDKIKDPTGIITFAATSDTEKTALMYSPAGSLSYYNMSTGRMKQRFTVEQGLTQSVAFSNNVFLAGIKDNYIYVIYALSGKTVASFPAQNPVILSSSFDNELYYLEYDGRSSYSLKMLENVDNKTVSNPRIIKNYTGPRNDKSICCGAKAGNSIMLGSQSGEIYRTDSLPDTTTLTFYPITENIYDKIFDMAPAGEDFYFLTRNAVFKSSYDTGIVSNLGSQPGQTQIISYGDNKAILWSRGTRTPVQMIDFTTKGLTDLFTPKTALQTVRLFGNTIIEIESNTVINAYNLDTQILTEVYTGAALQDAVLHNNGNLYIAKSSATNPHSALLCVNMQTRETVPMPLPGNVVFALNCTDSAIYGIVVQSDDNTKSTRLFSYNPANNQASYILRLSDEDPDAFTYLRYPELYTNIGKDRVRSCNLSTNQNFMYNRSASLPIKVAQNNSRVVILNRDGSISWFNENMSQVVADWYMTRDGQWYEF